MDSRHSWSHGNFYYSCACVAYRCIPCAASGARAQRSRSMCIFPSSFSWEMFFKSYVYGVCLQARLCASQVFAGTRKVLIGGWHGRSSGLRFPPLHAVSTARDSGCYYDAIGQRVSAYGVCVQARHVCSLARTWLARARFSSAAGTAAPAASCFHQHMPWASPSDSGRSHHAIGQMGV